MPRIFFIRHGETDWNAAARLQGTTDIPINATGRAQADRNGATLRDLIGEAAGFDFVSGPLSRTVETMQRVRVAMGLPADDFRRDENLIEVGFGAWEGKRWPEIIAETPELVDAYRAHPLSFVPPDGEGYGGAHRRALAWLQSIERDTVCVSHGGISRVLRGHLLDLPEPEIVLLKVPQDQVMEIVREAAGPDRPRGVLWH
ncbi:MAG: histidine phosphatase family protein [Pseudomonadota bacterium]